MDENSDIGGFPADIDAITKKLEQGEKITPEDIATVTKDCGKLDMDMWQVLLLFLLFGGFGCFGGNSSADYWRGKYDAYKEMSEKKEDRPS